MTARLARALMALLARCDLRLAPPPGGTRAGWLRGATLAHRGRHGAGTAPPVENSRAAFAAAIAAGLGIECDVQQTADGEAVVFHDFTLDRLTGATGPVIAHPAAALAGMPLAGGGGGAMETIPLLGDLLALVAGRVPLLIEVKLAAGQPAAPLCRAVSAALADYRGAHAVMSFAPCVPEWFAAHAPHTPRGLVMSNADTPGLGGPLRRLRAIRRARPDFLALDIADLPDPLAAMARRRGLPVASWTVRTPALLARVRAHADAAIAEGAGLPAADPGR